MRALINAPTDDAVMLLDSEGRMEILNERAAHGFGLTVDQMVGRPLTDVLSSELAESHIANARETLASGQSVRFEDQRAGRWYDNHMCLVFGEDESSQAVAIFARDITERKSMDQALAQAKEKAEKANLAKSRFLAAANHDLRQPLQAMGLLIQVLLKDQLTSYVRETVGDMKDALQSMEGMLNSLLDISKLEAGTVVPNEQNFPVEPFLQRLTNRFKALTREEGKHVRLFAPNAFLYTDPRLLERILQNFVSNAIRHTRSDHILIGCRFGANSRRIEVWDNGDGIPENQLDMVFEEFYQLGNPARDRRQGLGLGLSIAKRMADLLGLRLDARSEPGKGSVFSVEVPLGSKSKPAAAKSDDIAEGKPCRRCKILVVEDDQAVLSATRSLLDAWGYDAICAAGAEDALKLIAQREDMPSVALLDYRLPNGWNGTRLLHEIRSVLGHDLPGILLTGDTAVNQLREVQESGVPILHKPVDTAQLYRFIQSTAQKHQ